MANCLLAYPDKSLNATFSGGLWVTGLPLTNLKKPELEFKARSIDKSSAATQFKMNLGTPTHVRVLALIGHNASPAATIRVRCSLSADMSNPTFDSGAINMYSPKYPYGGLPYGHPDFFTGGTITQEELSDFPKDFYVVFTEDYSVQAAYVLVEIVDDTNPDNFFELSRCFVAPAYQPGVNMNYGASFGREPATNADITPGGPTYYDVRKDRRFVKFTHEVNEAQGMSYPAEIQRVLGIHGQLFFVFDPDDATLVEKQRSFLCTMRELNALEFPYFDAITAGYMLTEVL